MHRPPANRNAHARSRETRYRHLTESDLRASFSLSRTSLISLRVTLGRFFSDTQESETRESPRSSFYSTRDKNRIVAAVIVIAFREISCTHRARKGRTTRCRAFYRLSLRWDLPETEKHNDNGREGNVGNKVHRASVNRFNSDAPIISIEAIRDTM